MLKFAIAVAGCLLVVSVSAEEGSDANIGDIMAFQQGRHFKLWFAGRAGNWPLADYEIGKLKDGFDDVDKLIGGNTVRKAVGSKDKDSFTRAFDQLTAGCNSCHHTLDHAFIVIQRPAVVPYGNQSFAPQK
jgi:hypothetical protein